MWAFSEVLNLLRLTLKNRQEVSDKCLSPKKAPGKKQNKKKSRIITLG